MSVKVPAEGPALPFRPAYRPAGPLGVIYGGGSFKGGVGTLCHAKVFEALKRGQLQKVVGARVPSGSSPSPWGSKKKPWSRPGLGERPIRIRPKDLLRTRCILEKHSNKKRVFFAAFIVK